MCLRHSHQLLQRDVDLDVLFVRVTPGSAQRSLRELYGVELVSAVCKASALRWCAISPFPHVAAEHFTRGSVAKELLRLY